MKKLTGARIRIRALDRAFARGIGARERRALGDRLRDSVVAAMNVLFYAAVLVCCVLGIWLLRHKRAIGLSLIVLAALPFLHYAVTVIRAQSEPARRHEQIAELMQQREVPADPPRAVEMMNAFHDHAVETLVAVGAVDEVQSFNPYTQKTIVYTLRSGPSASISKIPAETRPSCAGSCSRGIRFGAASVSPAGRTRERARSTLSGERAPSAYTGPACLGSVFNYALELRWAPSRGGALLAFWESPNYTGFAFPPRILGYPHFWQCESLDWNRPDFEAQDGFKFVSAVLGYRNVDDFHRSPDPAAVPKTLRLLIPRMQAQYAHDHILACWAMAFHARDRRGPR